jgi:CDP-ribitol ribitolphosphotransferase
MSGLVVIVRTWLVRIGFMAGSLLPIRRRVVLASAHAERLTGNLAAIHDGIVRWAPDTDVVTLMYRPPRGLLGRVRAALHAVRAGYHLATARLFVVDDYFFPIYVIRKRAGTTIVQTWHASGAFKTFGYSVIDKEFGASRALVRRVRIHSNYDLCLVGGQVAIPHYAEAFGQPPERFTSRIGIPRTDCFFDDAWRANAADGVRRRYQLPEGAVVLLYAPTFRGTDVHRAHDSDELDLALLERELGTDHVLLVRLHPFVRDAIRIGPELRSFVIDVSDHPDINELMLVADHLVTDYSSAIFEFALLERPISFFAPDLAAYERERGFYFDYRTGVPGPVFTDTAALAAHLRRGVFDTAIVRRFRDRSFDLADGGATRRFVEQVVIPALGPR